MAFLCAFNRSNSSKQIRIHSRAGTNSAPRSAERGDQLQKEAQVKYEETRTDTTDQVDRGFLHLLMSIPQNWCHPGHYEEAGRFQVFPRGPQIDLQRSLTGGFICVMPTTFAIAPSAAMILPSVSGYSSPSCSNNTSPSLLRSWSSPHCLMTTARREVRSAAC